MANKQHPVEPVFTLECLDPPRKGRFDFNVMAEFEEGTGIQLMSEGMVDLNISNVRLLLYLMLVQEDEDLTLHDVGRMLHLGNFEMITEEIGKVFAAAMPETGEEEDAQEGNPQSQSSG